MPKKTKINNPTHPLAKTKGRSHGHLVKDPVTNQMVTKKIFAARKRNSPEKYKV